MIELEKRWKVKDFPIDNVVKEIHIFQYYIAKAKHMRTRLRKSVILEETSYTHCTKYFIGENAREEFESFMTVNQFERVLKLYPDVKVEHKKRSVIDLQQHGLIAEIDKYDNGDIVVEVEFYNVTQMENFIPPIWFGDEIRDKSFSKDYIW